MASEIIDFLKERFAFAGWASPEERDENVFVWRFDPHNIELPEWTLHAVTIIDTIEREPKASRPLQPKNPVRATDSIWTKDDATRALHLTTFECASREDARAQLLLALSELQSPIVERVNDAPGEVAFQMPKKTMLLFVRGNLVVHIRNAAEKVVNVAPTARTLDRELITAPESITRGVAVRAAKESVAVGKRVAIEVPDLDPDTTLRLIARGGELRVEKNQLVYQPHTPGEHVITAVKVRKGNSAAGRTMVRAK